MTNISTGQLRYNNSIARDRNTISVVSYNTRNYTANFTYGIAQSVVKCFRIIFTSVDSKSNLSQL